MTSSIPLPRNQNHKPESHPIPHPHILTFHHMSLISFGLAALRARTRPATHGFTAPHLPPLTPPTPFISAPSHSSPPKSNPNPNAKSYVPLSPRLCRFQSPGRHQVQATTNKVPLHTTAPASTDRYIHPCTLKKFPYLSQTLPQAHSSPSVLPLPSSIPPPHFQKIPK